MQPENQALTRKNSSFHYYIGKEELIDKNFPIIYLLELLPRSEELEEELLLLEDDLEEELRPDCPLETELLRLLLGEVVSRLVEELLLRLLFPEFVLLWLVLLFTLLLLPEVLLSLLLPDVLSRFEDEELLLGRVVGREVELGFVSEFPGRVDVPGVVLGRVVPVLGRVVVPVLGRVVVPVLGRVVVPVLGRVPGLEEGLVLVFGRIFTDPKSERRLVWYTRSFLTL